MRNQIMWAYIENIVIVIAISVLFYLTRSGWVFLFLLFMNNVKTKEVIDERD